jgi:hypothetical protein
MSRPSPLGIALFVAVIGLALHAADPVRAAVEARLDPPAVADPAAVSSQRTAAEHALARGYTKAVDQAAVDVERAPADLRRPGRGDRAEGDR